MLMCNTTLDLSLLHKQITTAVSPFYQLLLLPRLILCFVDEQWRIDIGWITYALSMVNVIPMPILSMHVYVEQSSRQFISARL